VVFGSRVKTRREYLPEPMETSALAIGLEAVAGILPSVVSFGASAKRASSLATNYPRQTTDANGFFMVSVRGLPAGAYNWRVQGPDGGNSDNSAPGFLANCDVASLVGSPQTGMDNFILKGGDAKNDNIVNSIETVVSSESRALCSKGRLLATRYSLLATQHVVGSLDFNILKRNFGSTGCPSTLTPEVRMGHAEALPGGTARERKSPVVSKVK
jgi:hypothetical protein